MPWPSALCRQVLGRIRHLVTASTVCRSVGTQSDSLATSAILILSKSRQGISNCRLDMQQARACWGLHLITMDSPFWRTRGVSNSTQLAGCIARQPWFYDFLCEKQCLCCFCNSCQPLCAVDPTAPGAGSRPGPTACNALFFGISKQFLNSTRTFAHWQYSCF